MGFMNIFASALAAAALVSADHDTGAKLDKPTLHDNLDYLKQGIIDNLPETHFTYEKQAAGTIPDDCNKVATGQIESSVNYSPADFDIFNVKYDDVSSLGRNDQYWNTDMMQSVVTHGCSATTSNRPSPSTPWHVNSASSRFRCASGFAMLLTSQPTPDGLSNSMVNFTPLFIDTNSNDLN